MYSGDVMKKIFILSVLVFFLVGCTQNIYTHTDFALNTMVTVTLYGGDSSVLDESFNICREYENILSRTVEGSDISKINREGSAQVNPETADIITKGIYYGHFSEGLFDISIGAVSSLWDFLRAVSPPVHDEVMTALNTVDFREISVQGNNVSLGREGAQLDLGGIAKGYIADKMARYIKSSGAEGAIINLGGNVVVLGNRGGKPFRVAIQSPESPEKTFGVLHITDKSVVTSGIYERNFIYNGKEYHHILNPETGYPHENELASVTVISDLSVDGDALSTVLFLMGADKGIEAAEGLDGVEALFILRDGSFVKTSGIGSRIAFEQN